MNKLNALLVAGANVAAPAPALAATLDLSATDHNRSSGTYDFAPGTYTVSLVSDLYTAWSARDINRNAEPWVGYYTYTANGLTTLFNPEGYARFATPAAALAAYSEDGPLTLTFTVPTAVTFAIADAASSFGDNAGGLSLNIAVVPEPTSWAMMALGFLGLGAALRRRRTRTTVTA